jgi:hypothetical protein
VFFVDLDDAREQLRRSGIAVVGGGPGRIAHLLDYDQRVAIGFFDHVAKRRM